MSVYSKRIHARIMVLLISFFMVIGNVAPSLSGAFYVDAATSREAGSWLELQQAIKDSQDGDTIVITKDIVAKKSEKLDEHAMTSDGSLLLRGKNPLTIKGPSDKDVHIYRDKDGADFPLFEVRNTNNTLILGEHLVLSGQTGVCSGSDGITLESCRKTRNHTLDEFEHRKGVSMSTAGVPVRVNSGKNLGVGSLYYNDVVFAVDNNGNLMATNGDYAGQYMAIIGGKGNYQLKDNANLGAVQVHDTSGNLVTSLEVGKNYVLYDPLWKQYVIRQGDKLSTGSLQEAINSFTIDTSNPGGSNSESNKYWVIPKDGTRYETQKEAEDALALYNQENPIVYYEIPTLDGGVEEVTDPEEAGRKLATYNEATSTQTCEGAGGCATYTSGSENLNGDNPVIKISNGTEASPKAFFVNVHSGGKLIIDGAKIKDFITDKTASNVAPIVVKDKRSGDNPTSFEMKSGSIEHNSVGYQVDNNTIPSKENVNTIEGKVKGQWTRTNTAGALILTDNAAAIISGGTIKDNRADTGAIVVQGEGVSNNITSRGSYNKDHGKTSSLDFTGGNIDNNVGVHYAGAVYAHNGGYVSMGVEGKNNNPQMNHNTSWFKGGAVYVSDEVWGTTVFNTPNTTVQAAKSGFVMYGGTMDDNMAISRAGAIEVMSDGVLLVKGNLTNNTSRALGGAIYVEGDGIDRMYTLVVRKGQISENEAVGYVQNAKLGQTFKEATNPNNNPCSFVNDRGEGDAATPQQVYDNGSYNNYYGYGGGIWLCSFGGNATFNAEGNWRVIVDNNNAADDNKHNKNNNSNEKGGTDIQVHVPKANSPNGLNVVNVGQNDFWSERTGKKLQNGTFYPGIQSIENRGNATETGGVNIKNNKASNGGGIAADGTVIFGEDADVYVPTTSLKLTKLWATDSPEWPLNIKFVLLDKDGNRVDNADMAGFKTTFNGVADSFSATPGGNDTYGENDSAWEQKDENRNSFAEMSIPWVVTLSDGTKYSTFTLNYKNGASVNISYTAANGDSVSGTWKYFDPAKNEDLAALWHALKNGTIKSEDLGVQQWNLAIVETDKDGNEISYKMITDKNQGLVVTALDEQVKEIKDKAGHQLATTHIHPLSFGFSNEIENGGEPEKPKVEKYVNDKVHEDLDHFDDEFEYSIMAWVPKDATQATISDTLVGAVEFKNKTPESVLECVRILSDNDHLGNGQGTVETEKVNGVNVRTRDAATVARNGKPEYATISLTDDTVTLTLKKDYIEAIFKDNGVPKDAEGLWVKMTYKAQYKKFNGKYDYSEVSKEANGWLTGGDTRAASVAEKADYIKENAEVKYYADGKRYFLLLDGVYYRSDPTKNYEGLDTDKVQNWVKADQNFASGLWDGIDERDNSLIEDVKGLPLPYNGYVIEGDNPHNGTKNQAGLDIKGGHFNDSSYKTNIVTVTPPVVKTKVKKVWENKNGTNTWPTKNGQKLEVKFKVTYNGQEETITLGGASGLEEKETKEYAKVSGAEFAIEELSSEALTAAGYTSQGGNFNADKTVYTVTNKEGDREPEIEKYVAQAVHKDITIDQEFWFDIHAYVTKDAEKVVITDTLEPYLKFATTGGQMYVWDIGAENNQFVTNNISVEKIYDGATVAIPATDAIGLGDNANRNITTEDGRQKLTVTINNAADVGGNDVRGHWIKVRFKAKIDTDKYSTIQALENAGAFIDISGTEKNDYDNDRAEANTGNSPIANSTEDHNGIPNKAEYTIKPKNSSETVGDTSNTVTVKPTKVKTYVEKIWKNADGTDMTIWPTGKSVTFNVTYNGVTKNVVVDSFGVKESPEFDEVTNGTFTVEEAAVTGYTSSAVEAVEKDGKTVYTATNTEKPGTPEIEKYVNQAVHQDILIDQTFKYDIIAYVTKDADVITISDTLDKNLDFVSKEEDVKVLDLGTDDNHKVANDKTGASVADDATVKLVVGSDNNGFTVKDITAEEAVSVDISEQTLLTEGKLTVKIDPANEYRNHWIKISFEAKIKDGKTIADLDYEEVIGDAKDEDRAEPNVGNQPLNDTVDHKGIANNANYKIKVGNNADKYEDTSNTVTVEPTQVSTKVEKKWVDANGKTDWPTGKKVTFKVVYGNGAKIKEKTVELSENGAVEVGPFDEVQNGVFTVTETGTTEGWTASAASEVNGVWTVTNTENKGTPEIEKYVNNKVHDEIKYFDKEFEYEIMAYVPKGAKRAVIKDTLVKDLTFTDAKDGGRMGDAQIAILTDKDPDHKVDGTVKNGNYKNFGTQPDFHFDTDENGNDRITVTIKSGNGIAYVNGSGAWVRLKFKAKIKDTSYYDLLDKLTTGSGDVSWSETSEDKKATVGREIGNTANWPVLDGDATHEGIDNKTGYQVSFKDEGEFEHELDSNTVTVKPEYTKIYAKKAWEGSAPEGWSVDIVIKDSTGKEVNSFNLNADKTSGSSKELPLLTNDYTVEEKAGASNATSFTQVGRSGKGTETDPYEFTNKENDANPTTVAFKTSKSMKHDIALAEGEYSFELYAETDFDEANGKPKSGVSALQTKSNAADATVSFDAITLGVAGTYTYFVVEKNEGKDGVIYSNDVKKVTVVATKVGDNIVAKVGDEDVSGKTYELAGGSFENSKKFPITITKQDMGGKELEGATIVVAGKAGTDTASFSEEWTSTKSAHELKLEPGDYTMTETVEPAGYQRVTTTISFKVKPDGTVEVTDAKTDPAGFVKKDGDKGIILMDAPLETPEIEKYVNTYNADDRDETVHTDLSAFDQVYTYDIQAYITNDAGYVVVTDQLKSVLEFAKADGSVATDENPVDASDFTVVVKDGAGKDGITAPTLTSEVGKETLEDSEYTIEDASLSSGLLKLEMGTDSKDAPKLGKKFNGKWLQITFNAKIKDEYRSIDAIKKVKEEGISVWIETSENEPIDKPDASGAHGTEITSHDGIVNDSKYTVVRAGLSVNNESNSRVTDNSNEVTVKPETTKLKVEKTWANLGDGKTWPDDTTVTFGIFNKTTGDAVNGTIDNKNVYSAQGSNQATVVLNKNKTSATVTGLPKLEGVKYTAREIKVNDENISVAYIGNASEVASIIGETAQFVVKLVEEDLETDDAAVKAVNSKPEIEKYVEKDVQADIVEFDRGFTYDILAYVPAGSTKVVLSDELKPQLMLDYADKAKAEDEIAATAVTLGTSNNHNTGANGTVSAKGSQIDSKATVDLTERANKLSVEILNNGSLDGQWVRVSIKAVINPDDYDDVVTQLTSKNPDAANADISWAEVEKVDNKPVNSDKDHSGLVNKASYKVFVGESGTSDFETNEVTVKPETIEVKVVKKWAGDVEGDRPEIDSFKDALKVVAVDSTGTELNPQPDCLTDITATTTSKKADAEWEFTWGKLPKLKGVTYKVKEDSVPEGYTVSPASAIVNNNGTITNTRTENKKSLKVKKVWEGVSDSKKFAIEIQLMKSVDGADPVAVQGKKVTLDGKTDSVETTAWEYTWTDLPERENGKEIIYSAEETNTLPEGFKKSVDVDGNTYTFTNTKGEIEKYVNPANASDADRDETVHTDLSAFDEVYTYDIQAYIHKDAAYVEVTDNLVEVLEFVGKVPVKVLVKDGPADGSAPTLSSNTNAIVLEASDYTLDSTKWEDNKLFLTMGSEEENAPVIKKGEQDLTGKWLQITFNAKIKDDYRSIQALSDKGIEVWTEISENDPIDSPDNNSNKPATSHTGVVNDSTYKVVKAGAKPGNDYTYTDKSNRVTVNPKTTKIEVDKEWWKNGAKQKWPTGASVKVKLQSTDASDPAEDDWTDVAGKTATLKSNKTKHTFNDLPVLEGVTYRVKEDTVTNAPTYSVGEPEEVKDGEWKIKNETYTPEIEKYVNADDVTGSDKDGNVHTDLSFFDQDFVYDIQAWITPDATSVKITDELNKALEFVGSKDDVVIKVKNGDAATSAANAPTLSSGEIEPHDTWIVDAAEFSKGKLVVTAGSDEDDADRLQDAGKWIHIQFKAKIKDDYRTIAKLQNTPGVWTDVEADSEDSGRDKPNVGNDPIDDVKINNVEGDGSHEGILNNTEYTINKLKGGVGNAYQYSDRSNTVTVKPQTTEVEVSKTWLLDGVKADWPEGAEVQVKLMSNKDGEAKQVGSLVMKSDKTYKFEDLPCLEGVTYRVEEGKVTNRPNGKNGKPDYRIGQIEDVSQSGETPKYKVTNKARTPEEPPVEKYINGNVHEEINLDEVFTYDIIGYVPEDADKVTFTDELNSQLQFAKDGADVKVYVLDSDNHMTVDKAKDSDKTASVKTGTDITDEAAISTEDGKLTVSLSNDIKEIDDEKGRITYNSQTLSPYRGKWIRVEFKAQLADDVDIKDLKLTEVKDNDPLLVTDEQREHTGVENHAKYVVEIANEGKYEPETNVVTVIPKTNKVKISKQDIGDDTKELPGAKIKVEGPANFTEEWISTDAPHELDLPKGKYKMTEVVAPEGFQRVTTVIEFEVDEKGNIKVLTAQEEIDGGAEVIVKEIESVDHLILKDAPIPVIKFSKQNFEGEELSGAQMQLKDSNGKLVDKWTSNGKDREIQLMPGTYFMKEVVAPEDYVCVTTEIEFEVKEDGTVILKTATVDKGGDITVMNGDRIVLKDAPDLIIEKTVNEKKNLKIRNRDKIFTYIVKGDISYTPEEFFGVIDNVPDVMNIVNQDEIYIVVNGERLSTEERDKILIIEGNKLRVEPDKEIFKEWGPFTIEIVFQCRFKADADLTPYLKTGVVNEAFAIVDGVFTDVKGDSNKAKVMPEYEDSSTSKSAKTGDSNTLYLWMMVMIMASALVAVGVIRRRRNNA